MKAIMHFPFVILAYSTFAFTDAFTTPKTSLSRHASDVFAIISHPVTTGSSRILSSRLQSSSFSNKDNVVYINPDFRLSSIFLVGAIVFAQLPYLKFVLAPIAGLLGILFLVQTFRLKFVCDSEAFELLNTSKESGENILVGGKNRWTYDSFVNYEFFPKGWIDQPQGPILVYFKETQTQKGQGASANLIEGAVPGQAHFFPALCNTKQLRAEWEKKGCTKL